MKSVTALFWGLLVFFTATASFSQSPLTLNTFAGPPLSTPDQAGMYDLVLREAFTRIGVPVRIGHLPAERSLLNADRGIDDGDFVRIAGLETTYTNLIRVPEKITDFEFVAFSRNLRITTPDWESLRPYDVAIVRGWKILEKNLAGAASLTRVKNLRILFTLLAQGRADLAVYSRFEGYEMINRLGLTDIQVLEPPLAVREMFLYLHKKHAALVPEVTAALRAMKADGTYQRIVEQTLGPYRLNSGRPGTKQTGSRP